VSRIRTGENRCFHHARRAKRKRVRVEKVARTPTCNDMQR
jgi:hypothetical protein